MVPVSFTVPAGMFPSTHGLLVLGRRRDFHRTGELAYGFVPLFSKYSYDLDNILGATIDLLLGIALSPVPSNQWLRPVVLILWFMESLICYYHQPRELLDYGMIHVSPQTHS